MFVGWKNTSDGFVISDRFSTDYIMPLERSNLEESNQKSTIIALQIPLPDWANTGFSFTRALSTSDVVIKKSSSFIYAFSDKPPIGNLDLSSAKFRMHGFSDCGSLGVIDFISPHVNPATSLPTTSPSQTNFPIKSKCAASKNTFCVYGEPDELNRNLIFTIHAKAGGVY